MIEFRCWYCNRKHTMPQKGVGKTIRCVVDRGQEVSHYRGEN
jgi:hypothetical protein